AVAQSHRRAGGRRSEQRFDVVLRERLGKPWCALGRIELQRGIGADEPLAHAVLVETLDARDAARGAGRAALLRCEKAEERGFISLQELAAEKRLQMLEVRPIGGVGVLR